MKLSMDENQEVVMSAILFRLMGIPLSSTQEALLEAWSDISKYHKEVVNNFANPEWVDEQLRIFRDFPEDEVWERIQRSLREGRLDEVDTDLTLLG